MRRARRLLAAVLLAGLAPSAALASPLTTYGFDPRALAMGGAQTAAANDATATFYNPALLTTRKRVTFGFGLEYVRPEVWVKPVSTPFKKGDEPRLPEDFTQWTLGILFPLGGKVRNRIALGVGISLPGGYIVRAQSVDPAQPYFYVLSSSAQKIEILPAFGVKITSWLSAGAGLQVLADLGGTTNVQLNLFTHQVKRRDMQIDLTTREALTAGISVGPFHGLMVGLSFRQELGLDYTVPANIDLVDVGTLDLTLKGTAVWSPHEVSLGAAWTIPGAKTTVAFDMTYAFWSRAPSPQVMVILDTGGPLLDGFGLGSAFDMCSEQVRTDPQGRKVCTPIPPGFVDALSPHVGVEHRLNQHVVVRAGYWFRPTPIPNQVGRTNYLDASTHHVAVGAGFTFKDPLDVFQRPVTIDLAAQASFLDTRNVDKGSNGTVDYRFGGQLWEFSAAVRYQFK